jgi:WD40 repeat protein
MDVHNIWMNSVGSPITACEIASGNVAIAGMTSGGIMACELGSMNMIPIGFHESPICKVFYCKERSFLISLGYDKLIRFWDLNQALVCQMQIQLPHKTFTACYDFPYLIIGSEGGLLASINVATITATTTITPDTFKNFSIDKASKLISSSVNAAASRVLLGTADGKAHQFDIKNTENGFYL